MRIGFCGTWLAPYCRSPSVLMEKAPGRVPGQSAMNLTSAHEIWRWDCSFPLRDDSKQKGLEHELTLGRSPTSIEIATNRENDSRYFLRLRES